MSFFLKTPDRLLEDGLSRSIIIFGWSVDRITCLIVVFISSEVFRLRFGLQVANERFL
jgi:hypothetical protein